MVVCTHQDYCRIREAVVEVSLEAAPVPALPRNSPMTVGKKLILLGPQFPEAGLTTDL